LLNVKLTITINTAELDKPIKAFFNISVWPQ
jgi:hypothetical protein